MYWWQSYASQGFLCPVQKQQSKESQLCFISEILIFMDKMTTCSNNSHLVFKHDSKCLKCTTAHICQIIRAEEL